MIDGDSHATSGHTPMAPAFTTRNAVVAAMHPPSMLPMCSNHQCMGDVGTRSQ